MNQQYGLHVEKDGTITLAGKPFYGFGVNLYTAFVHCYERPETATYREQLALMKFYNIPFVRMPLSGYLPNYYKDFDRDPEAMMDKMQLVLDEAERQQIGIIVSLMWWDPAVSGHMGEKRSAMGDPSGRTVDYARGYTALLVERFKHHKAVWGWEIGNEYNLTADMCDPKLQNHLWSDGIASLPLSGVTAMDYYTTTELHNFYTEIAKEIRAHDTFRLISSGNGDMREFAFHLHQSAHRNPITHLWTKDTTIDSLDQFYDMNAYLTPDPMDTVCFHLQHGSLNDTPPHYDYIVPRFGRSDVSHLEYFHEYKNAAKRLNKGLFFGECGDFMDMEAAPDIEEKFQMIIDWIVQADIQLAATWQFSTDHGIDVNDKGIDGYKLHVLQEANKQYRMAGQQIIDKAWQ